MDLGTPSDFPVVHVARAAIDRVRFLEGRIDQLLAAIRRIEDECDEIDALCGDANDGTVATYKIRELIGDA